MGQDYHDVLSQRLQELVRFISKLTGKSISHRVYTDTGPLLERELAQRAGLGWIGKNSCLIHPKMGSYLFLGEILLGLDLDIDPPFDTDRCGSCTRCIEACPTGCILPNRTLDARQCISYLTIEHKGLIPYELRECIGEWVFGCDICQQVCPWNHRFARESQEPSFQPISFLTQASLHDFLSLEQDSFRESFRGSPFKRPKWHGILRNASIVAGNSLDPRYIPDLGGLLLDNPEPIVRSHAAWALGCIGGNEVGKILAEASLGERDPQVLAELALAKKLLEQE
jgi:epoxyqueuosine reductase